MKIEISANGFLWIISESGVESYALVNWLRENPETGNVNMFFDYKFGQKQPGIEGENLKGAVKSLEFISKQFQGIPINCPHNPSHGTDDECVLFEAKETLSKIKGEK